MFWIISFMSVNTVSRPRFQRKKPCCFCVVCESNRNAGKAKERVFSIWQKTLGATKTSQDSTEVLLLMCLLACLAKLQSSSSLPTYSKKTTQYLLLFKHTASPGPSSSSFELDHDWHLTYLCPPSVPGLTRHV